jgi:galactose mutarotase-like enzyme
VTSETPPEWAATITPADPNEEVHGFGSNHDWSWNEVNGAIALSIDYPDEHPIRCVHRWITPDPTSPALDLTLRIEARSDAALPLGLHFTFRLPPEPGSLSVEPGKFREGRTYPGIVEPGATAFAVNRSFSDLTAVPAWGGGLRDASRLPLDGQFEELIQLNGIEGRAAVTYPFEGFRARIEWDPEVFPSLLLWISNKGRSAPPWLGRHFALGMEPVRSPFGLGPGTAATANPLNQSGTPTARLFRAGEVLETRYRLSVEAL